MKSSFALFGAPRLGLVLSVLASFLVHRTAQSEPPRLPEVMIEDAELNDVYFRDERTGWAVGDRGVIWRTDDGGRNWVRQTSLANCRLESISFADPQHGWIAGGWLHPHSFSSRGVVLRTSDGGRHWTPTPRLALPSLKRVRFLDSRHGWALGDSSPLYPAGVFRSADGGRTWKTVPSGSTARLLTGDFSNTTRGVVAGRDGELRLVMDSELVATRTPDLGRRPVRALRMNDVGQGWLAGDDGLLMKTSDGGVSWQRGVNGRLLASDRMDFAAIAIRGSHVWVAGSPGARILHSPDHGQTWEAHSTGQSLPIHALHFVDPNTGWAVGALGLVMRTDDGGRSWRAQKQGGDHLALLGLFSANDAIPVELFTQMCGDQGYLGVAESIFQYQNERGSNAAVEDRVHQALAFSGASGGGVTSRFPLLEPSVERSRRSIVESMGRSTDGQGLNAMEEFLVARIRMWRPEAVVTDDPTASALARLTAEVVRRAIERAGEPTAFVEQTTVLGLEPWKTRRLYTLDANPRAAISLSTTQLSSVFGKTIIDASGFGRGLLQRTYQSPPATIGLRPWRLSDQKPAMESRGDFLRSLALAHGGGARRSPATSAAQDLSRLQRAAQKRRNVNELLRRVDQDGAQASWLGQLDEMTAGLGEEGAGQVAFELAHQFRRRGRFDLAADALERLVTRTPESPFAEQALAWLVQFHASGEASWRMRRTALLTNSETQYQRPKLVARVAALERGRDQPQLGLIQASGQVRQSTSSASVDNSRRQRGQRAIEFGEQIQRTQPSMFADPRVRFPLSTAQRRLGVGRAAESFLTPLAGQDSPWAKNAAAELWLSHMQGRPPKAITPCFATAQRPHLNGQLDDPLWRAALPLELKCRHASDENWRAVALFAYDAEYLYFGVSCQKHPAVKYAADKTPRARDADLQDRDRVTLMIDIDRDYATYYRLTIDHRGWGGDACLGDVSWNPKWHISAVEDDRNWSAEAAIPLRELTPDGKMLDQTWAIGAQRVAPNVGFQSWTEPASDQGRPEGFGLLRFDGLR